MTTALEVEPVPSFAALESEYEQARSEVISAAMTYVCAIERCSDLRWRYVTLHGRISRAAEAVVHEEFPVPETVAHVLTTAAYDVSKADAQAFREFTDARAAALSEAMRDVPARLPWGVLPGGTASDGLRVRFQSATARRW